MFATSEEGEKVFRYEAYDFNGIPASEGVYGIHKYPAMLHFKLVDSLISEFSKEGDLIYDPFCGSGVTLNVAIRKGRPSIGTDINPLAVLIAKVRSYVDIKPEKYLYELKSNWNKLESKIPPVRNIDYWFKDYVIRDLGKIRKFLDCVPEGREKEFLLVVFSQTVRNVSLTRKGEFKRYRMHEKDIKRFNPRVLEEFIHLAKDYLNKLRLSEKPKSQMEVFIHDVRKPLPFNKKVSLVITSPPYGDSRTTVAYGEFFSFSLEWLGDLIGFNSKSAKDLDRESIGGRQVSESIPPLKSLEETLENIYKRDRSRAEQVKSFYIDLFKSIKNISKILSEDATVCFIVGNRRVKGCNIPMDIIVKEMFEYIGLYHYETRIRRIHNKRLPSENSPTNRKGEKDSTINYEFIVIMKS